MISGSERGRSEGPWSELVMPEDVGWRRGNAMPLFPARGIDPADQILDHQALRERDEANRRAEADLAPEIARLAQHQRDAGRIDEWRIADVHDVGQRDTILPATITDDQRVTLVPDAVDKIEDAFLRDDIGPTAHHHRQDEGEIIDSCGYSRLDEQRDCRTQWNPTDENNRKHPFDEESCF